MKYWIMESYLYTYIIYFVCWGGGGAGSHPIVGPNMYMQMGEQWMEINGEPNHIQDFKERYYTQDNHTHTKVSLPK